MQNATFLEKKKNAECNQVIYKVHISSACYTYNFNFVHKFLSIFQGCLYSWEEIVK